MIPSTSKAANIRSELVNFMDAKPQSRNS
jgi:hypothetical protein